MSERLYIWVTNWERFQPRSDRPGLPWFRVYTDLADDGDWLDLSCDDRVLLLSIWCHTQKLGNGRVVANQKRLCELAYVGWSPRSRNLERLTEAGFITLSTTKGEPTGHQIGGLEERRGTTSLREEKNARDDAAENGAPRRSKEDMVKQLEEAIAGGYQPGFLDTPEGRERWEQHREY